MKAAAIVVILVCSSGMARADVLDQIDETLISSEILETCHTAMSEPSAEENTHAKAKMDAFGKNAWHQFWDQLDRDDPAHHEENGKKADYLLKKRMENSLGKGRALVAEKGCAALVPHAHEVLVTYLQ